VVRHDWTVGDMVIWDNTGVLHRVTDHDPTSARELHRATVAGEEPIK
jgi:alpha-ketoglutarate-dependent taurine dioxygenase